MTIVLIPKNALVLTVTFWLVPLFLLTLGLGLIFTLFQTSTS